MLGCKLRFIAVAVRRSNIPACHARSVICVTIESDKSHLKTEQLKWLPPYHRSWCAPSFPNVIYRYQRSGATKQKRVLIFVLSGLGRHRVPVPPPSLSIISSNVISSRYVQSVQKGSNINIAEKKVCFKSHQSKSLRTLVTVAFGKGSLWENLFQKRVTELNERGHGVEGRGGGRGAHRKLEQQGFPNLGLLFHLCPPGCTDRESTCWQCLRSGP